MTPYKSALDRRVVLHVSLLLAVGCCVLFSASPCRCAIVDGGDISTLAVENFESIAQGAYSTLNNSTLGISFGEKLLGQINTPSGIFDRITGNPITPLALDPSVPQAFGVTVYPRSTNTIAGLGPNGYPDFDAVGEGSLAVLYDVDQHVISFEIGNFAVDLNRLDIQLYSRSGTLLADLTIIQPTSDPLIFSSTGEGIAAIIIDTAGTNTGGGLFDNFRFRAVPEPSTMVLATLGAVWVLIRRWQDRPAARRGGSGPSNNRS